MVQAPDVREPKESCIMVLNFEAQRNAFKFETRVELPQSKN
jgi:hypothetical protein